MVLRTEMSKCELSRNREMSSHTMGVRMTVRAELTANLHSHLNYL